MTIDQVNILLAEIRDEYEEEVVDIIYDELMMERELQRQYEMMSYDNSMGVEQ